MAVVHGAAALAGAVSRETSLMFTIFRREIAPERCACSTPKWRQSQRQFRNPHGGHLGTPAFRMPHLVKATFSVFGWPTIWDLFL